MPPDDPTARPDAARGAGVPATPTVPLVGAALPAALAHLADGALGDALSKAIAFAQRSVSPATEKIYDDDWRAFRAWCQAHGAPALPAPPAIVAAYLAERAATLGRSGLRLILAAIAFQHRRAGHLWTARDPVIATVMRGILRAQQRPERPAAALTSAELRQLLAPIGDDPTGLAGPATLAALRDRALLLTGLAGALRRSELVALDVEDVRFRNAAMVLRLRRSKGDQEGEGADVVIPRGAHPETCPARAMEAWLRRSGIAYGAVFRRITAPGTIEARLTGNGVWKILRRRASAAGLTVDDTERLSPHGLRAGFITEAYLHGALDEQVQQHARQKSIATTRRYRQRAKVVAASPARLLDL
jgi:integrase